MRRHRAALLAATAAVVAALAIVLLRGPAAEPPARMPAPAGPPAPSGPFVAGEELRYEFGWNDLPAAVAVLRTSLAEHEGAPMAALTYEVETTEALRRIWSFRATGRTLFDPQSLRPELARYESRSPGRAKLVRTRFDWPAGRAHVHVEKTREGEVRAKDATLEAGLDLGAAFMLLRCGELPAEGEARRRVLSGDDAYLALIAPLGAEAVETPAGRFQAVRYALRFRKLDEDEAEEERRAEVWISREGQVPVRLEVRLALGRVYGELVERRGGQ